MAENISQKTLEHSSASGSDQEMPLMGHFNELRKRLLIILIGLAVGVIISFAFADRAIQFLAQPIGGLKMLQSIEITENMGVFMRVSLLGGFHPFAAAHPV